MADPLKVTCPCCKTLLGVDRETGDVLTEERPKNPTSFEDALGVVQSGETRRDKAFNDAFERTRRLDDVLEKKFEEARKKAAKDKSEKPFNPMDLD